MQEIKGSGSAVLLCAECGDTFRGSPSRLKDKVHTCSRDCLAAMYRRIKRKHPDINCIICGKKFYIKPKARTGKNCCSRECLNLRKSSMYSGRKNPNVKYYKLDDNFFQDINTPGKAYLLGWILSDGTISESGVTIALHSKDSDVFDVFNKILGVKIKTYPNLKRNLLSYSINSKKIAEDILNFSGIQFESKSRKKSHLIKFPKFNSEKLSWMFLRGYFEGDGSVRDVNPDRLYHPSCSISSKSISFLHEIQNFVTPKGNVDETYGSISWNGVNAVDFLYKIYDGVDSDHLFLIRKRNIFDKMLNYRPALSGVSPKIITNDFPKFTFKVNKTDKDAVFPFKSRASDAGYDVTAIGIEKVISDNCILCKTGIRIQMPVGFHLELVPRSSIIKTGYMLANSIGIIDTSYIGEILVALIKVNKDMPDLEFPIRIAQLIPKENINIEWLKVDSFDDVSTDRNSGGFGSTGYK